MNGQHKKSVPPSIVKCQISIEGNENLLLQVRKQYHKLTSSSILINSICQESEKHFGFFNKRAGIFTKNIKHLLDILINVNGKFTRISSGQFWKPS